MKIFRLLSRTATLAGLAAVSVGAAYAQSITPVFTAATPSGGNFIYTYGIYLDPDTGTKPNDLLTFYDFNGLLTGGAFTPTFTSAGIGVDYSITTPLLGINPPGTTQLAGDNPSLPNVTLTETGAGFSNSSAGAQFAGTLTVWSANPVNGTGDYTPFAANSTKVSNSSPAGNQSFVHGPNTAVATPEPGTWAMFVGMGVSGGVFLRRRNRRK